MKRSRLSSPVLFSLAFLFGCAELPGDQAPNAESRLPDSPTSANATRPDDLAAAVETNQAALGFSFPTPSCGKYQQPCCLPNLSCNSGYKCVAGFCAPSGVGQPCLTGDTCPSGLACVLGICGEVSGPGPLPPPVELTCTSGCDVGRSQRVLVFVNTTVEGGLAEFAPLYHFIETSGSGVVQTEMGAAYDRIIELRTSGATEAAFLNTIRTLEQDSTVKAIDVVLSTHGNHQTDGHPGGRIYFVDTADNGSDVFALAAAIRANRNDACTTSGVYDSACACGHAQKLRALYSAACWGNDHMQAWLSAGFKVAAGAQGVHADSAASFPTFLEYWHRGYTFQESVDRANSADSARVYDNVAKLKWSEANSVRNTSGNTGLRIWSTDSTCYQTRPMARVFADSGYQGAHYDLPTGRFRVSDLLRLGISNDSISSLRVPAGTRLTVYSEDLMAGAALNVTGDLSDLGSWDNQISSIVVTQTSYSPAVTLYEHPGYYGYGIDLGTGSYGMASLRSRGMRDDEISSVRIYRPLTVAVFSGDNFTGRITELLQENPNLGTTGWDNALSSIAIAPSRWTSCASEDGTCTFAGNKVVRFGDSVTARYSVGSFTNSVNCHTSVFGDPARDIRKACWFTSAPPANNWISCASENGACYLSPGVRTIAYGANGSFYYRSVQSGGMSLSCNNATWGDPAPNTSKSCYVLY